MRIFVINLLLLLSLPVLGQSPFELDAKRESVLLGLGLGGYAAGLLYEKNIASLSLEQIAGLEDEFIDLDEWAIEQNSNFARLGSDVTLGLGNLTPALLFFSGETKGDRGTIALMYFETMSLTLAATGLTKRLVLRPRPFNYNPDIPINKKLTKNARFSFFSGHTSMTAAACFFTASVWTEYNMDSKWKIPVWTVAASLPAVTGFLRVKAGKHFPSDVMTGYVVGAGMGMLVPWLHRTRFMDNSNLDISIAPNLIYCKLDF